MVKELRVAWPTGQDYSDWTGEDANSPRSWVKYKLKSADSYIDLLRQLGERLGGHPRDVGVEMALDGALAAVSGAFDSAVAGFIQACEYYDLQAAEDGRGSSDRPPLDPWRYNWHEAKTIYSAVVRDLHSVQVTPLFCDVDAALQTGQPLGWLQELRRLRNGATHQRSLARHWDTNVHAGKGVGITVGDSGADPVLYLREARERVGQLTDSILGVCEILCPNGIPTAIPVTNATARPATIQATSQVSKGTRLLGRG